MFIILSAITLLFVSSSYIACDSEEDLHESNRAKDGAHVYKINEDEGTVNMVVMAKTEKEVKPEAMEEIVFGVMEETEGMAGTVVKLLSTFHETVAIQL